jgi:hypothetical protein
VGSSMESPSRTQLSGVKEEPWPRQSPELEDQYFGMYQPFKHFAFHTNNNCRDRPFRL